MHQSSIHPVFSPQYIRSALHGIFAVENCIEVHCMVFFVVQAGCTGLRTFFFFVFVGWEKCMYIRSVLHTVYRRFYIIILYNTDHSLRGVEERWMHRTSCVFLPFCKPERKSLTLNYRAFIDGCLGCFDRQGYSCFQWVHNSQDRR